MYALLGYFYMFFSMIDMAVKEFKTSRWTDVLDKLIRIRDEESLDYNVRFFSFLNSQATITVIIKGTIFISKPIVSRSCG